MSRIKTVADKALYKYNLHGEAYSDTLNSSQRVLIEKFSGNDADREKVKTYIKKRIKNCQVYIV